MLNYFITPLFLVYSIAVVMASDIKPPALEALDSLTWQYRIILIKPQNNQTEILQQLQAANADIIERDIVWFVLNDKNTKSNYTGSIHSDFGKNMEQTYFKNPNLYYLLIGKDGYVKKQIPKTSKTGQQKTLDLTALFQLIDTMPMRQNQIS